MAARSFFAELKRRNVLRAALLYVGAVWALAQGIALAALRFRFWGAARCFVSCWHPAVVGVVR